MNTLGADGAAAIDPRLQVLLKALAAAKADSGEKEEALDAVIAFAEAEGDLVGQAAEAEALQTALVEAFKSLANEMIWHFSDLAPYRRPLAKIGDFLPVGTVFEYRGVVETPQDHVHLSLGLFALVVVRNRDMLGNDRQRAAASVLLDLLGSGVDFPMPSSDSFTVRGRNGSFQQVASAVLREVTEANLASPKGSPDTAAMITAAIGTMEWLTPPAAEPEPDPAPRAAEGAPAKKRRRLWGKR
jgi:hypothetical protein